MTTRSVPCGSCHLCCENDLIILHPEDGDVIDDYDCSVLPDGRWALKQQANGNCIYLTDEGCAIHDRSPAVCREFDCRLFLNDDFAGEVFRAVEPELSERVLEVAKRLVQTSDEHKASWKRCRAIPGRKRRRGR